MNAKPLTVLQQQALLKFTHEWDYCPAGIHIKTLVCLIERELVLFKEILPWIPGVTESRWKGNFKFCLPGDGRKPTYYRHQRRERKPLNIS